MEKHTCKLCFRRFANGRALGGHMRSHVASAAAAALSASASSSSSQGGATTALGLGYVLRENPKKSFKLADPEFVDAGAGSSVVVQDDESETESPRPKRLRSRRAPALRFYAEPEPASSVSDTTPEEDVALSLMMLSRDFWSRSASVSPQSEGCSYEEKKEPPPSGPISARTSWRSRYQCGTCKKVFRSYQALGGHRASHKKESKGVMPIQTHHQIHEAKSPPEANANKIHECPICFRVFSSGQALGGHKRSHLSSYAPPATLLPPPTNSSTSRAVPSLIDLNLPPEDDVELSAVSDADFVPRPTGN